MAKQPNNNSAEAKPVIPTGAEVLPVVPTETNRVFTPVEWLVAALTFLVSGFVYFHYLSPEVTLEDSGELVTGAFNFGVPHPTGYPFWAFLGFVWRHLVPFGNPAWRLGLMSVATGAALTGFLTLLMSRSVVMLLRNSPWGGALSDRQKEWLGLAVATAAAMMYAFDRGIWQWACVPEMRALNVFSFVVTTCLLFAWVMRPERHRYLYGLLLIWGLSLANHQTIIVMMVPFIVGMWVVGYFAQDPNNKMRYAGLLEVTFGLLVAWACGVLANAWLLTGPDGSLWNQRVKMLMLLGPVSEPLPFIVLAVGCAAALLMLGVQAGMMKWQRAATCAVLFVAGLSMYAYMPIAAATNPPMNWGYAATKQGFLHAITRGQYEQLHLAQLGGQKFWIQMGLFWQYLLKQYSWPVGLFAVVPVIALLTGWQQLRARGRQWLIFSIVAFLVAWVGLIIIINPEIDKTQQEINLKFFAPAHCFFVILIGYGLALSIAWATTRWPALPRSALCAGSWMLVALAVIPFNMNWATCEQRGHDFGYQFGYRMFYPGGSYQPMDRDAFLFGGTDPGRFVPTYMIFSESAVPARAKYQDPNIPNQEQNFDRRDVYIVTQNALADTTYMAYIRDHYDYSRPNPTNPATLAKFDPWQRQVFRWGWHTLDRDQTYPKEPIWIPTEQDSQRAFQEYVADVQNRRARGEPPNPDEDVELEGGRVQVRGVKGVMNINAILCKWIHDHNKAKHTFYVEESYVIDWMFPYLQPYGIIMKINAEPLPSPNDNPALWSRIIGQDKAYWDKLVAEFTARPEFWRDNDARKTFSKLRSAIGGVYAYRKLYAEAQYAYRQSLQLCPDSPEANFRTSQLLLEIGQPDAAIAVLEEYHKLDLLNSKIELAINQIRGMKQAGASIQQLEQQLATQPHNLQLVGELAKNYLRVQQSSRVQGLFDNFIAQPATTAGEMLQIAQFYLSVNQAQLAVRAVEQATQRYPQEADPFYALAVLRGAMGATNDALTALQRAIQINPAIRDRARNDQQFGALRANVQFQALVTGS